MILVKFRVNTFFKCQISDPARRCVGLYSQVVLKVKFTSSTGKSKIFIVV